MHSQLKCKYNTTSSTLLIEGHLTFLINLKTHPTTRMDLQRELQRLTSKIIFEFSKLLELLDSNVLAEYFELLSLLRISEQLSIILEELSNSEISTLVSSHKDEGPHNQKFESIKFLPEIPRVTKSAGFNFPGQCRQFEGDVIA